MDSSTTERHENSWGRAVITIYGICHFMLRLWLVCEHYNGQWANDSSYEDIVVFLVSYLQGQVKPNIQLTWTIEAIFDIRKGFKNCMINKVHQDQIHSAHVLAKRASKDGMRLVFTSWCWACWLFLIFLCNFIQCQKKSFPSIVYLIPI